MTEEQIEQMAEEYSEAFIAKGVAKASLIKGIKLGLKQHSYEYLVKTTNLKKKYEKQIAELEAQVENMKCCENCEYFGIPTCRHPSEEQCSELDKWELAKERR